MKKQDMFELIEYRLKKQDNNFRKKVEYILAEEKAAGHIANMNYLEQLLDIRITRFLNQENGYFNNSINEKMIENYCYFKKPKITLDDIALSDNTRKIIAETIEEQEQSEKLHKNGLDPRNRILLQGPPGNGKTSLAEAIANAMNIPFLIVRQEQTINSLLGKTAQNLYNIFSFAVRQPCVLFIDEFDAIGIKRHQNIGDSGEISRIVNSILKQIDALPSYVILIVATNREDIIDKALCRRFQLQITLPMPKIEDLTNYYAQYIKKYHLQIAIKPSRIAEITIPCSYANAEELIKTLHRKIVLHGNNLNFEEEIHQWKEIKKS